MVALPQKILIVVLCSGFCVSCHQNLLFYSLPEDEMELSPSQAGLFSPKPAGDRFSSTRFGPEGHNPSAGGVDEKPLTMSRSRRSKNRGGWESDLGASQSGQKKKSLLLDTGLPVQENSPPSSEKSKRVKNSDLPALPSSSEHNLLPHKEKGFFSPSRADSNQLDRASKEGGTLVTADSTHNQYASSSQGAGEDVLVDDPSLLVSSHPQQVDILFVVTGHSLIELFLNRADRTFKNFTRTLSPLDFEIIFLDSYQSDNEFFAINMRHKNRVAIKQEAFRRRFDKKYRLTSQTSFLERVFVNTLRIPRQMSRHRLYSKRKPSGFCHSDPFCKEKKGEDSPLHILTMSFQKDHFRQNATVAAVVITDHLPAGSGESVFYPSAQEVFSHFDSVYKGEKDLIVYGISPVKGDGGCFKEGEYSFAPGQKTRAAGGTSHPLLQLIEETGGQNYSLCADSYVPLAKKMVFDLKNPYERL